MLDLEIQNTLTAENPDSNRKKRRMVVRGGTSPVNRCNWLPRSGATVEVPSSRSSRFSSNAIVKLFCLSEKSSNKYYKHKTTTQPDDQLLCQIFPNLANCFKMGSAGKLFLHQFLKSNCTSLMGFPPNFCYNLQEISNCMLDGCC